MSAFGRFPPRLQEAIVARLGWTRLRPVQEMAADAVLDGANAIVLAPTAGGKTEAAVFPALAKLMERASSGVGAVYFAPIKALLNNQEERFGLYTEMVGLRRFVWHGDVGPADRQAFLRDPAEVLMTTPESLEVMMISQRIPVETLFRDLETIIIDEVHAFAGTDRGGHLLSLLERLSGASRHDLQRIGLSATVGNPGAILAWLSGTSTRPQRLISPTSTGRRRQIAVHHEAGPDALARTAAQAASGGKSLLFCQRRALAEAVADRMRGRGIDVFVHHSSIAASERAEAERRFQDDRPAAIVCTSTLELGIDIGDLDSVIQIDAPSTVSSFLQRMGRTGRRPDQIANTTFLCQSPEAVLQAVAIVELARKGWVEPVELSRRRWPVLVHQILAMALAADGTGLERVWSHVRRVPDFAGIDRAEFDALIDHMLREGWLIEAGGQLCLGEQAERRYGRRNFLELFAVFSSPVLYRVRTADGRDVGSLEQDFVDRIAAGLDSFLLAGRAWQVVAVDHEQRTVSVAHATGGREPIWSGFLPQLLSGEICAAMKSVVADEAPIPYASASAQHVIDGWRADLSSRLKRTKLPVIQTDHGTEVWTFAGGRINATIRLALKVLTDLDSAADNLCIRFKRSRDLQPDPVEQLLSLDADKNWDAVENATMIGTLLPAYRLSKFQEALPVVQSREILQQALISIPEARRWLKRIIER